MKDYERVLNNLDRNKGQASWFSVLQYLNLTAASIDMNVREAEHRLPVMFCKGHPSLKCAVFIKSYDIEGMLRVC